MWEDPELLWRRLYLGREEFLQRLVTTLICGGDAPRWNQPCRPSAQGVRFLQLLDVLAHGSEPAARGGHPEVFVDEYLLPKIDASAKDGWPDWAVLWPGRVWIIELKTERGSHRADQLPYYLQLAAATHPGLPIDLTYITGPLSKPEPTLLPGQRYSHLQWTQVLELVEDAWGADDRPAVIAYVDTVRTIISNLTVLRPMEQRDTLLSRHLPAGPEPALPGAAAKGTSAGPAPATTDAGFTSGVDLLAMARATAADGEQRAVGAASPTELEDLRDTARSQINELAADDPTRFVLPWLWKAQQTDGRALTPEGEEFGYELRFSRYKTLQVR